MVIVRRLVEGDDTACEAVLFQRLILSRRLGP
jgi:hypothetical protein